jgi:hypothetical protein
MTRRFRPRDESGARKFVAFLLLVLGIPSLMTAQEIGWPRDMTQNGAHIIYYQPQIDEWSDYRTLNARMAISVTPAGGKPTPGVVSIQARTDADKETRIVVISDIKGRGRRRKISRVGSDLFRAGQEYIDFPGSLDGRSRGRQSVSARGQAG